MVKTARCGWYYRVIEAGEVAQGDTLELVERAHDGWTVMRVFKLLLHKGGDAAELEELAGLERLSADWRGKAAKKLG